MMKCWGIGTHSKVPRGPGFVGAGASPIWRVMFGGMLSSILQECRCGAVAGHGTETPGLPSSGEITATRRRNTAPTVLLGWDKNAGGPQHANSNEHFKLKNTSFPPSPLQQNFHNRHLVLWSAMETLIVSISGKLLCHTVHQLVKDKDAIN